MSRPERLHRFASASASPAGQRRGPCYADRRSPPRSRVAHATRPRVDV